MSGANWQTVVIMFTLFLFLHRNVVKRYIWKTYAHAPFCLNTYPGSTFLCSYTDQKCVPVTSIYHSVPIVTQAWKHARMSVQCLLWLFMAVEINILYGFVSDWRGIMETINQMDLCTMSWHINTFYWGFIWAVDSVPHHTQAPIWHTNPSHVAPRVARL